MSANRRPMHPPNMMRPQIAYDRPGYFPAEKRNNGGGYREPLEELHNKANEHIERERLERQRKQMRDQNQRTYRPQGIAEKMSSRQ